jgi:hypothetical protein
MSSCSNVRLSVFRVEDGSFVRHVATGLDFPFDVEECEGGWLVSSSGSSTVEFVGGDVGGGGGEGRASLGKRGRGDGEFKLPSALALVPGPGQAVREEGNDGRVQFFIAMASMSAARVGWMVALPFSLLSHFLSLFPVAISCGFV